ncbi:MAG: polyprenyl diphosphate synthase, partial [Aliihoeflea sp.]
DAEALTRTNTTMNLVIAFNYGARDEIVRATRHLSQMAADGHLDPRSITPEMLSGALDTADIPDPDLIIRTSGEQRLSNFLLWQAAYAEFVFLPCYWPDFDRAQLDGALAIYADRDRRFGAVAARGALS